MAKSKKGIKKPFKRKSQNSTQERQYFWNDVVVSSKPDHIKALGKISKKSKRFQKTSQFITKLSANFDVKEKLKKAKIRAQTVIVGDMDPLLSALTDIVTETKSKGKKVQFGKEKASVPLSQKKKKIPSEKTRHQSNINDMALFQRVISLPKFQTDPLSAITEHVKYFVEKDQ